MLAKDRERRPAGMREVLERTRRRGHGAGAASVSVREDRTVAVMSFANITGRPEDDWLGTGIAETVAADLKSVPGSSIVSRERMFEILRKLGAGGPEEALAVRLGREVGAAARGERRLPARGGARARHRASHGHGVRRRPADREGGRADGRGLRPAGPDRRRAVRGPAPPRARDAGRGGRGDAERRGLRGLHQGPAEPPVGDAGGARPGHPLLRARGDPRPLVRARPHASWAAPTTSRPPTSACPSSASARSRASAGRSSCAPLCPRLARARRAAPRPGTGRGGDRGARARARPGPRGRQRLLEPGPRALHRPRRLRPRRRGLREGPDPEPPGGLERAPARALRRAQPRLPPRRVRRVARRRPAGGVPLRQGGGRDRGRLHPPRPDLSPCRGGSPRPGTSSSGSWSSSGAWTTP